MKRTQRSSLRKEPKGFTEDSSSVGLASYSKSDPAGELSSKLRKDCDTRGHNGKRQKTQRLEGVPIENRRTKKDMCCRLKQSKSTDSANLNRPSRVIDYLFMSHRLYRDLGSLSLRTPMTIRESRVEGCSAIQK